MFESCEKPVVPFAPEIPFQRDETILQKVSIPSPSDSWDAIVFENNKREYRLHDISINS